MDESKLPTSSVLLLRVAGDEASSWISVFQVLSWLSSRVSRIYSTVVLLAVRAIVRASWWVRGPFSSLIGFVFHYMFHRRSEPVSLLRGDVPEDTGEIETVGEFDWILRKFVLLVLVFSLLPILYVFIFQSASVLWTYLIRSLLAFVGLAGELAGFGILLDDEDSPLTGTFLVPILLLLIPISVCFMVLGVFAFGLGTGLLAFFDEVSVESSPVGAWEINLVPPMRVGALHHSQIYENPNVVSILCSWMSRQQRLS